MIGVELHSGMSMDMIPIHKMSKQMEWYGGEAFDSMYKIGRKGLNGSQLYEDYEQVRSRILMTSTSSPLEERIFTIASIGRSRSGKGGLMMGWRRLFLTDLDLTAELGDKGLKKLVHTLPYSVLTARAKHDGVVARGGVFGKYTQQEHQLMSEYGSKLVFDPETGLLSQIADDEIVVLLLESSAPATIPSNLKSNQYPVEVIGRGNRGNSIVYDSAVHSLTRRNFLLYALDRNPDIDKEAERFRENIDDSTKQMLYQGQTKVVLLMDEGYEVEVEELPLPDQLRYQQMMEKCMASNFATKVSNKEIDDFKRELSLSGRLGVEIGQDLPSDLNYYRLISRRVELPGSQFRLIGAHKQLYRVRYDLNYYIQSWYAKLPDGSNILDKDV